MIDPNYRTVTLKLQRHQVVDLLLLTCAAEGKKWEALHDLLRTELDEHDEKWRNK